MVKVQRLHKDAIVPRLATHGSAGYDLCTVEDIGLTPGGHLLIPFGWAFEIPEGLVGLLFIRSSFSKKGLYLGNAVGVIDSGFRGELKALENMAYMLNQYFQDPLT
jgi:dUTP pyrophosphatase